MIPNASDIDNRRHAVATAEMLLDSGCVRFDEATPFQVAPGMAGPLHVDLRPLLGWPDRRDALLGFAMDMVAREIQEGPDAHRFDAVACCTEGPGVPMAALLADRLRLPLVFVRRCAPGGGRAAHKHDVEGRLEPGWRVLLVEQLATDGHRKAAIVNTLAAAGATVSDLFVVFQYGVFDAIHEHLAPLGVRMHALATWWDVLDVAGDRLPPAAQSSIRRFLKDPTHWRAEAT